MTLEEKGDATLAIVILAVVFFLGLFVGKVWACDSYEDCMKPDCGRDYLTREYNKNHPDDEKWPADRCVQEAIAYKLDEISQKLTTHGTYLTPTKFPLEAGAARSEISQKLDTKEC